MKLFFIICFVFLIWIDCNGQKYILELNRTLGQCTIICLDKGFSERIGSYPVLFQKKQRNSPVLGVVVETRKIHDGTVPAKGEIRLKMFGIKKRIHTLYVRGAADISKRKQRLNTLYMEYSHLDDCIDLLDGNRASVFFTK